MSEVSDALVESVCLFHWQVQLVIKLKKNKTSPTVILSFPASLIGKLFNKTKSDRESLLALFSLQQENKSYADPAVFISVQTGQNLQENVFTFYKSHPHPQECFLSSLHVRNTFSPVLDSAVSHYFRYSLPPFVKATNNSLVRSWEPNCKGRENRLQICFVTRFSRNSTKFNLINFTEIQLSLTKDENSIREFC